jgi:hypothetical protein
MDLDEITEMMDRLVESDPSSWADRASVEALQRQLARFEAFVTKATGEFDAWGDWGLDDAGSAVMWLVTKCRMPKAQARRQLHRARHLRRLPECATAWADGDITGAHVDRIASLRRDATEEALDRDEALLVDQARNLRYDAFVRTTAYWEQLADPDGAEADYEKRHARREMYLVNSFGGMWLGKMTLDPISGAVVSDELDRIREELFEADWAASREDLGRDPTPGELSRTPDQRRADALVEMATRSRSATAEGRRSAPLFSVLVDYPTLQGRICELAQGTVVPPGSLLPWLDRAYIERVVFGPDRRVEVSATARLFTGATRRAIELRDRECTHPFCDVPAASCQVDHITPYAVGGPTTQENGRLLCGAHNRLRNQRPPPGG